MRYYTPDTISLWISNWEYYLDNREHQINLEIWIGRDSGLSTLCHSCGVCLSAKGSKNVYWPWLSPFLGWGSLTIVDLFLRLPNMCQLYLLCSWRRKRKSLQNCWTTIVTKSANYEMDSRIIFYLTEEKNPEGMTNLRLGDEILLGL